MKKILNWKARTFERPLFSAKFYYLNVLLGELYDNRSFVLFIIADMNTKKKNQLLQPKTIALNKRR